MANHRLSGKLIDNIYDDKYPARNAPIYEVQEGELYRVVFHSLRKQVGVVYCYDRNQAERMAGEWVLPTNREGKI